MADEKTARGKPLPKEEVDFVLIGAGGIVVIVSWQRVGFNSFSTNSEVYPDVQDCQGLAQCQPIVHWKWFCQANVIIWPGLAFIYMLMC